MKGKKDFLFFNRKAQITISVLLIFFLIFQMFSIVFFSSTESLREYEFRNAMDLALLSAGADLSKGIQLYCTASVIRLALFGMFTLVWLTVFIAPDQIETIINVTENIRKLSNAIGKLQEEIPLIYTIKAEVDAYRTFNNNYMYTDAQVVIFLPNSLFNGKISGNLNSKDFYENLKDVDSLKEGFFGLGSRKYTLLLQLKNKLIKSSDESSSYLDTHDVFINSCKVEKRENSEIDLSVAKKLNEFLSCWDDLDNKLNEEAQGKIQKEAEDALRAVKDGVAELKLEIRTFEGQPAITYPEKYFPSGEIVGLFESAIEIIQNRQSQSDDITSLGNLKTEFMSEELRFKGDILSLKGALGEILSKIELIQISQEPNNQYEGKAKEADLTWLQTLLNNVTANISTLKRDINSIKQIIEGTKEILGEYGISTGSLDTYKKNLDDFEKEIDKLDGSIKSFESTMEITGNGFVKSVTASVKKLVECGKNANEAFESIKGLRVMIDIATLNGVDLISNPGKISDFKEVITKISGGDFSFISYYSPELSMPDKLISNIANLPVNSDELINKISVKVNAAIDGFLSESAVNVLNGILSGPIEGITKIESKISEQILMQIAFSAAGALVKGALSFGIGALLGIIQGVVIGLVQGFITKIVVNFVVDNIGKGLISPLVNEISDIIKGLVNKFIRKEDMEDLFRVFKNLDILIPRLIGQFYPRDYINFDRYYLQKLIRLGAEAV
jgi:hypothetical protein